MRIRIKFAKKESVKYLGHLDIMRFFQRCFNRADVRMEYSAGYNPHQKMSFAQPLGVGIISSGEYLDAEIADGQDLEDICRRLNEVCGEGFEVFSVRAVEEGAKKAMAALAYASYIVDIEELLAGQAESAGVLQGEDPLPAEEDGNPETLLPLEKSVSRAINDLLCEESIPVIKRTKSGEHEVDIRPQIIHVHYEGGRIFMTVTAGSNNNLKPDTLTEQIISKTTIEYQREKVKIKRDELYAENFVPLKDFQTA